MDPTWAKRLRDAQRQRTYLIDGEEFARLPHGRTGRRRGEPVDVPCHDCGAQPGEYHVPTCDMERCPRCRGQVITCGCVELPEEE